MRINKYLYMWVLQGKYDTWEDLTAEDTYREIRKRGKEYIRNAPGIEYRIVRKREVNPAYKGV